MSIPGVDLLDLDRFQRLEHHEMFKRLRNEAPVYWTDHPMPGVAGFWSVSRHKDLIGVNRDTASYSSEVGGVSILTPDEMETSSGTDPRGLMMLYMDPPKHTRYRLLVNKGFTPRMIGLIEKYLEHRAVLIVDNIIERGACDFVEDLAAELPLQAIAEIMGVPQDERRMLFDWSNRMIGLDDPEYASDDGNMAAMELFMYSNNLAKQWREDPRYDIVTKLINAEVAGDKLSEIEFDMFMMLLTVAGNETTRNTTAWGMWGLMQNPEQYAALAADIDGKLDRAIEEILRWATPVYHFRRTAMTDTAIAGQDIKQGDKVVIWHTSADRDETVFDDPYSFNIERWPNEHIAFGGGPHFCLGANLARMELKLIFREILERIPDMKLTAEPSILRSNFIGGIKHMPVTYAAGVRKDPTPVTVG